MEIKDITTPLVAELIKEQFPQWAHLAIKAVEHGGIDNRTFRLGNEMLVRLPSAAAYSLQARKEQKWLPLLKPHLSIKIPEPLAMGQPSTHYPWNWSIYKWIEGESANRLDKKEIDLGLIAVELARFLKELHTIDTLGAPSPGAHNFYRGAHPSVYDAETRSAIEILGNQIDARAITAIWEKAIRSRWNKQSVWVHGDFSSGNILIKENRLEAVIDFGCTGIGDPACDLVIAWTFLDQPSRAIFKQHLEMDPETWDRARGWALWKALIVIAAKRGLATTEELKIVQAILKER